MQGSGRGAPLSALALLPLLLAAGASAQSITITAPTNGQVFVNTAAVEVKGRSVTGPSACYSVNLFVTLDGQERYEGNIGYGTINWSRTYSVGVGGHSVRARTEVRNSCTGQRGEEVSGTVAFSIVRQPDAQVVSLSPANGATLSGPAVQVTAVAASAFGGLAANEELQLSLYLDGLQVIDLASATTPLRVDTTFQLGTGEHTVRAEARIVDAATDQDLNTDSKHSFFTVFAPALCDGGVCELTDGNSRLVARGNTVPGIVDDGFGFKQKTPGGVGWTVDGKEVMFAQWHWFRIVGGARTGEIGVGSIEHILDGAEDAVFTVDTALNQIVLRYSGSGYPVDIEIRYDLRGDLPQSFRSAIDYKVIATNRTGSPLDVDWYVYQDLDLNPVTDRASSPSSDGSTIRQTTCAISSKRLRATDSVPAPPDAYNLGVFGGRLVELGGPPTILDDLLDAAATNLGSMDNADPDLATDRIHARQYRLHLLPGQPVEIQGTVTISPFANGDLNCDDHLEYSSDFPEFLRIFGRPQITGVEPDYDGDGVVGLRDYGQFRHFFEFK